MQRAIGANRIDIRCRIGSDRRRINGCIPNVIRRKNITAGDLRWRRRGRGGGSWRACGLQGGGCLYQWLLLDLVELASGSGSGQGHCCRRWLG